MLHPISYLPSKWAPKVDGPPVHLLRSNWSPRQSSCSPRDHLLQSKWVCTNSPSFSSGWSFTLWVCVNILAMMQLVKHLCVWAMTCSFPLLFVDAGFPGELVQHQHFICLFRFSVQLLYCKIQPCNAKPQKYVISKQNGMQSHVCDVWIRVTSCNNYII